MSNQLIDTADDVRDGEELDVGAVDAWLKQHVDGLQGRPEVTQFSGGASNWTYRLAYPSHDLILRRPPAGTKAASAHDMAREYRVQERLKPVFPYVPPMVALCEDTSVIGAEFYVMERLPGIIPRANMPRGLEMDQATARRLCHSVIDKLVALHQVDVDAAGLGDLGRGTGYVKRQIEGWTERFERARTWNVPRFSYVTRWLTDNMPEDVATCVIHNDFRLDNCVLDPDDPTKVIGILDWEMACLAPRGVDLGWMAYMHLFFQDVAEQLGLPGLPGFLAIDDLAEAYEARTGFTLADRQFWLVFAALRYGLVMARIEQRQLAFGEIEPDDDPDSGVMHRDWLRAAIAS